MEIEEKITQVVFHAIDNVNQELSEDEKIEKSFHTELIGHSTKLDSLGLVNLIVAVEEGIQENFGETVTLANANAMSSVDSPFKNVQSLVEYLKVNVKGRRS